MPVLTVNELIDYLKEWRDKDQNVVYTIYSVADLDTGWGDDGSTESNYKRWKDNIGRVDKAMEYAEQEVNQALTEIFGGEN